jgi:hypothetical protein
MLNLGMSSVISPVPLGFIQAGEKSEWDADGSEIPAIHADVKQENSWKSNCWGVWKPRVISVRYLFVSNFLFNDKILIKI